MKKTLISAMAAVILMSSSAALCATAAGNDTTGLLLTNVDIIPKDYSLKISLNKNRVTDNVGKNFKLRAKTNVDGYDVNFLSTNKKVACVNSKGAVKLKGKGTAKIVAECNGVKSICKVSVKAKKKPVIKKVEGNSIKDSTMSEIAGKIGWQTQHAYPQSEIMCSAYSYAYAYYQVTEKYRTPGSFWYGGCTWDGGTYSYYNSSLEMLSAIKSQLDNNKACVGLLRTNSSSTHYVTFYSYTGNGTNLSDYTVIDPWDGQIKSAVSYGYSGSYDVVTVNT